MKRAVPILLIVMFACSVQPEWTTHGNTAPHKAIRTTGVITLLLVPPEVSTDDQALLTIADYYAKASPIVMLQVWTDRSTIPLDTLSMPDEQLRARVAVVSVNNHTGHRSVQRAQ